jgi:hypothetical protein
VRKYVNKRLAAALRAELEAAVKANDSPPSEVYSPDSKSAARRDLKNTALGLLATLGDPQITAECLQRCRQASGCPHSVVIAADLYRMGTRLVRLQHAAHSMPGGYARKRLSVAVVLRMRLLPRHPSHSQLRSFRIGVLLAPGRKLTMQGSGSLSCLATVKSLILGRVFGLNVVALNY